MSTTSSLSRPPQLLPSEVPPTTPRQRAAAKRGLLIAGLVSLAMQVVGAAISIGAALPAQVAFGDTLLDPADATPALVAQEFLTKGTALAPPVFLTIAFAVMLFLATRRRAAGVVGAVLLTVLSVLFTVATLGEYANPDRFPDFSSTAYLLLLILNQITITATILFGVAAVVAAFRNRTRRAR
ncbi:MAG TPA: hypothetical protein VIL55_11020 [Naasia sp.]|jgi:hypothetical protein